MSDLKKYVVSFTVEIERETYGKDDTDAIDSVESILDGILLDWPHLVVKRNAELAEELVNA